MRKISPVKINCSTAIKNILCEALRNYTYLVLPKTTTTYNPQQKHELLIAIEDIEQQFIKNRQCVTLHEQLHPHCYAAIDFHYNRISNELNATVDEQRKLMFDVIEGIPALDAELDFAMQKDNII